MRVISGEKRGKKLITLDGEEVRPTTDRIKESVFNVLQFEITDKNFLDMFAGSGQMAIEALSRGAKTATLIDFSQKSIKICEKNLISTNFLEKAKLVNSNSIQYVKNINEVFDIAFLDPPYHENLLVESLTALAPKMSKAGIIVCEHPLSMSLPAKVIDFEKDKQYKYGKIELSVYRNKSI